MQKGEPMSLIDREALIAEYDRVHVGAPGGARKLMVDAPEVRPEQRWVPCSERLPEEREWIGTKRFGTTISDEVYVTFEVPDGQRFTDHISFQNGKLSASDAERMRVWYKGAKPVAWMPLPEPWKGEEDEAD
jgi:hypothetical protein